MPKHGRSGAYILSVAETGMMYIGSSKNVRNRLYTHKWLLKKKIHYATGLQEAFDAGKKLHLKIYLTEGKHDALDLEKQLVEKHYPSGKLFNTRKNVGTHIDGAKPTMSPDELAISRKGAILKHRATKALSYRRISIKGIEYNGTNIAVAALGLSYGFIDRRLRSKSAVFKDWFFID